jgi:hypothetical protein
LVGVATLYFLARCNSHSWLDLLKGLPMLVDLFFDRCIIGGQGVRITNFENPDGHLLVKASFDGEPEVNMALTERIQRGIYEVIGHLDIVTALSF